MRFKESFVTALIVDGSRITFHKDNVILVKNTKITDVKVESIESFNTWLFDKKSLMINHTISIRPNLECKKYNLKKIEDIVDSLLILV